MMEPPCGTALEAFLGLELNIPFNPLISQIRLWACESLGEDRKVLDPWLKTWRNMEKRPCVVPTST